MNEAEWLSCDNPLAMLSWLGGPYPCGVSGTDGEGRGYAHEVTERRLRLFACAAWRIIFLSTCTDPSSTIKSAEAAEEHADDATCAMPDLNEWVLQLSAWEAAMDAVDTADHERPVLASVLRATFGNPWRPVTLQVTCPDCNGRGGRACDQSDQWYGCRACDGSGKVGQFDPDWLTTQVLTLAQSAYQNRQPDGTLDPVTLAALADALIEAGCPETVECPNHPPESLWHKDICQACHGTLTVPHPVLAQLRGREPLYRGVWSIDLLLGKS